MTSQNNSKTDVEVATPSFQHPQKQSQQPEYNQVFTAVPDLAGLIEQVQDLENKVHILDAQRVNLNTDIIGMFETLTVAPTGVPFNIFQQIKIAKISGTSYLYVYDTLNHVWLRATIT